MAIDLQIVNGCQQFNAALFVIAPKDLQELDFSGMHAIPSGLFQAATC